MQFDFDKIYNRRNTGSLKWDIPDNEIPLWVADMDFQTAPAVVAAIEKRAKAGIFGYNIVPDAWYEAICNWWSRRHNINLQKDWLIFCTGVIPAITSSVKRVTNVGENVLVQTPVYDIFFHSIENTGRHVVENKLVYEAGVYNIDFEALETQLSDPLTTMMLLCNPQNPGGRIWTKEELGRIGELCSKYHVTVLSDEIHCDITEPGIGYIPFASVSAECAEMSITCISATKAFNIAGIQTAAVIIPNENLRKKIEKGLNSDEVAEPNSFATDAVIAAFNEGEEWLDQLRAYLWENRKFVEDYIKNNIPALTPVKSQATYLMWLDCSRITANTDRLEDYLRKNNGVYLSCGSQYRGNGANFLRLNLACPRSILEEGISRLKEGIEGYRE